VHSLTTVLHCNPKPANRLFESLRLVSSARCCLPLCDANGHQGRDSLIVALFMVMFFLRVIMMVLLSSCKFFSEFSIFIR
jgi:hypothetical protein